jgi:hypothetical protein
VVKEKVIGGRREGNSQRVQGCKETVDENEKKRGGR